MTLLPGWHPFVVHFPLALVLTAATALAAARFVPNPRTAATLATVGTWNLVLGALAILLALGSGLAGVLDLELGAAARGAVAAHVKWAATAALLVVLLAVWRGAGAAQEARPSRLFLAVLAAACLALVATGHRGAINVYRFGIGVAAPVAASAAY